jgi:protein transport protein SEC61 subunit gamma-like protein
MRLNIKEKLVNYKRVLLLCRKPTKEEYILTTKICAAGIVIIGLVGFVLYLISILPELLPGL